MTELSFLLDLLLNHKLPKPTREAVTTRIREVEQMLSSQPMMQAMVRPQAHMVPQVVPPHMVGQSPSTIAAMMKHEQQGHVAPTISIAAQEPSIAPQQPQPVTVIAQTPAAQAALNARNEAIAAATLGKVEKGRTSPRKF